MHHNQGTQKFHHPKFFSCDFLQKIIAHLKLLMVHLLAVSTAQALWSHIVCNHFNLDSSTQHNGYSSFMLCHSMHHHDSEQNSIIQTHIEHMFIHLPCGKYQDDIQCEPMKPLYRTVISYRSFFAHKFSFHLDKCLRLSLLVSGCLIVEEAAFCSAYSMLRVHQQGVRTPAIQDLTHSKSHVAVSCYRVKQHFPNNQQHQFSSMCSLMFYTIILFGFIFF